MRNFRCSFHHLHTLVHNSKYSFVYIFPILEIYYTYTLENILSVQRLFIDSSHLLAKYQSTLRWPRSCIICDLPHILHDTISFRISVTTSNASSDVVLKFNCSLLCKFASATVYTSGAESRLDRTTPARSSRQCSAQPIFGNSFASAAMALKLCLPLLITSRYLIANLCFHSVLLATVFC